MRLQKIDGNMPDLIILDIMMPQMDGFEVCKKLKSDEKTKHIPIIMLTAKHELEDVKRAIKTDVDEYVTKPFEPELLRRRVEENFKARENIEEIKRNAGTQFDPRVVDAFLKVTKKRKFKKTLRLYQ